MIAHGTQGNASGAVTAGGYSTGINLDECAHISAFGTSSAAATITLSVSQDGTTWIDTNLTAAPGAGGSFFINTITAARFFRLKSSAASTLTATIAGK